MSSVSIRIGGDAHPVKDAASRRGGILLEAMFGVALLLALVGGGVWLQSLASVRVRSLVADRLVAWNRGIENRGYRHGLEGHEAEFVQERLFGEDAAYGHGSVTNVFYNWCIFGGSDESRKEGVGPAPLHWMDDDWALYHNMGDETETARRHDVSVGQNHAAVGVTIRTPFGVHALLHDTLQFTFNRMQRDLPATFTVGGREGGATEGAGGERQVQVSACVTMRTQYERLGIDAPGHPHPGDNAETIRELRGNWFPKKEQD